MYGQSAAGCLVKFDDRILTVRDHWSNRLSIPGGGIGTAETPRQAAEREAYEETGVRFKASELVATIHSFAVYACEADDLEILKTRNGGLKLLVPEIARSEVAAITLTKVADIDEKTWRFPSQVEEIRSAAKEVTTENHYVLAEEAKPDSTWIYAQLKFARAVQRIEVLSPLLYIANFFGERYFFFLILPLFLVGRHRAFGLQLATMIVFSAQLNGVLKEILQTPRPIDLWGSLELVAASGYGFPSGHTQVAATFYTLIGLKFKNLSRWVLPVCLLGAALTGLARVYFGAHFVHDVVVGWLVGVAFASLFFRRWNFWIFFCLSLAVLPFRFLPDAVGSVAAFMGLLGGIKLPVTLDLERRAYAVSVVFIICGMFAIPLAVAACFSAERTFITMLARQISIYLALGCWAGVGTYFVPKWISRLAARK